MKIVFFQLTSLGVWDCFFKYNICQLKGIVSAKYALGTVFVFKGAFFLA